MKNKQNVFLSSESHFISEIQKTNRYSELLEQIIENAPDGIYITDGEANAVLINQAFERISGLDRNKLLGKNQRDLVRDGLIVESCALESLSRKCPVTIIHNFLTTGMQALDTCTPIFDENGEIVMTVSSIRDMTELNTLEARYKEEVGLRQKREKELEHIRERVSRSEKLIAEDEKMTDVLMLANKMAQVDSVVMITGETGVGKEEIAQYIHNYGTRAKETFVSVNCGAIPAHLIESELFGYESGAFTGAQKGGKVGLFEAADKGTLFLDEVGELPLSTQVRLLRCLQNKKIKRVGGTEEIPVDVRIISATNRNLMHMVKEGTFREDLYYRLCVVPIQIPPLRERLKDIKAFADYFLNQFNEQYQYSRRYSPEVYRALFSYDWPGNVRELKNKIERAVVTSESDILSPELFFPRAAKEDDTPAERFQGSLKEEVEQLEYRRIEEASANYPNVRQAAASLGMSEPTFVRKRAVYRKKFGSPA